MLEYGIHIYIDIHILISVVMKNKVIDSNNQNVIEALSLQHSLFIFDIFQAPIAMNVVDFEKFKMTD